ncbi:DNA alkylation repair protein [Pseudoalteromonas luteoviolacea]|uniref:DNA alkylation repair protein n=1 Tax=Pseudoalteromonas luteoviolacea TaxID=43657 RepID=A0A1C0TW44_9GAMM|nr:DNA alkylation repair protein [Pseudoalteromonas luteoviolacea]OCQ23545.1 DNA alkylation repair protein [Pseudoalteromonas luteoviolacea]
MNIIETAWHALAVISYPEQQVKTAQIRKISSNTYKLLTDHNIDNVLTYCEQLLSQRDWALSLIAYDWAFRVKRQYTPSTFDVFEHWLFEYVIDWYDCDDFCTHAFGELLAQHNDLIAKTHAWATHPHFTVRRAMAVILIYPIKKMRCPTGAPMQAANLLLNDQHDLVQKGYGWMLKVLSQESLNEVIEYLKSNHQHMPRVAFRYAIEKLDKQTRTALMSL